ncbi:MAG TPA: hypothetical protein VK485_00820 [Sphingomicrobium sp.]|nr:hypothetical protein [Sphingomicrobium sp.]
MNQFEMVVLIVAIVMFASVMRAKYGYSRRRRGVAADPAEQVEAMRLKDEVKQLKERIHVLERIATDKEDTLSRQIEELRDRK